MLSVSDWVQIGVALFAVLVAIAGVIAKNIIDLNRNILIIVGRVDTHEKRVDTHEKRLDRIESVVIHQP